MFDALAQKQIEELKKIIGDAILAERELCARIAEDDALLAEVEYHPGAIAAAIRARGQK